MSNNLMPVILFIVILTVFIIVKLAKSSLKTDIEQDAKKYFRAKEDLSGNLILKMQGYSIILEYDLTNNTRGLSEYIIANVALPALDSKQLKSCKKIVDIQENNGKFYAIIYASWGYRGQKFRERLEQKLGQIIACLKQLCHLSAKLSGQMTFNKLN